MQIDHIMFPGVQDNVQVVVGESITTMTHWCI